MGLSGTGLMPCVHCVLPRPGTHCILLARVSADLVWHCLCVSSDGVYLCLLCAIRSVLARLCGAVHGLLGTVAVPGRGGAGPVLNGRVG